MVYNTESMFGIAGKTAVIVGAVGGMGSEISKAFSKLGARIVLVDLNIDGLQKLETEIKQSTSDVISLPTDVTNKKSVQAMAENAFNHFGHLDVLINCAGLSHLEDAVDFAEDKWDLLMSVNVKGTFLTCQAVGKYMLKQKTGQIVNFSSVRGLQGRAKDMAYAPSKGAINQLTKSLAIEWAESGVNVNAIAPTFILTEMNRGMLEDKETYEWVLNRIPKRRLGTLKDIIGPLVFLCSPCSEFITGQILYVDGGWTAA